MKKLALIGIFLGMFLLPLPCGAQGSMYQCIQICGKEVPEGCAECLQNNGLSSGDDSLSSAMFGSSESAAIENLLEQAAQLLMTQSVQSASQALALLEQAESKIDAMPSGSVKQAYALIAQKMKQTALKMKNNGQPGESAQ